jgi:hypothetical protein
MAATFSRCSSFVEKICFIIYATHLYQEYKAVDGLQSYSSSSFGAGSR